MNRNLLLALVALASCGKTDNDKETTFDDVARVVCEKWQECWNDPYSYDEDVLFDARFESVDDCVAAFREDYYADYVENCTFNPEEGDACIELEESTECGGWDPEMCSEEDLFTCEGGDGDDAVITWSITGAVTGDGTCDPYEGYIAIDTEYGDTRVDCDLDGIGWLAIGLSIPSFVGESYEGELGDGSSDITGCVQVMDSDNDLYYVAAEASETGGSACAMPVDLPEEGLGVTCAVVMTRGAPYNDTYDLIATGEVACDHMPVWTEDDGFGAEEIALNVSWRHE